MQDTTQQWRANARRNRAHVRTAVGRATFNEVECLESRRLLSGAPVLTVSGAPTSGEGQDYVLSLNAPSNAGLTTWTLNWGDGTGATPDLQTVAIGTPSVMHKYADAGLPYHVTATATDGVNTYAANTGSSAPNGALDASFGAAGKVTDASGPGAAMAIGADGKTVVVGSTPAGAIFASRYNIDGTLDTTFAGGTVTKKMGNADLGTSVAIQADGKIVIGGALGVFGPAGISYRPEVLRFNVDGSLDSTFGTNGAFVMTPTASTAFYSGVVNGIAIDTNGANAGKIVLAGYAGGNSGSGASYQVFTGRLNADGSTDNAFGATGFTTATYSTAYTYDRGNALVIQADDKIVVAGDTNTQPALVRFTSTGAVDASFGVNGWVYANGIRGNGTISALTLDGSGNILGAGVFGGQWGILRVNAAGTPDASFGNNGALGIDSTSPAADSAATGIAMQSDGQILVTGYTGYSTGAGSFVTARYNPDGSADTHLGAGGSVVTSFGSTDAAYAIAVRPTGQIVVAGRSGSGVAIEQFAISASATPVLVFVADVPPVVSLANAPTTVAEGTAVSLTATITDPNPGGLNDTWTVSANGNVVASGTGAAIHFTPADNGAYVINFTANDPGGATASASATVNVTNVAPTAVLGGDTIGVRGQTRHLALGATDPSAVDTAAGFTYSINWGDGTATQTVAPGQPLNPGHAYKYDGNYKVTVIAKDKDGGTSAAVTQNLAITAVALEGSTLAIGGLTADDLILIGQTTSGGVKTLKILDDVLFYYKYNEATFNRVDIYQSDANGIIIAPNVSETINLVDANGSVVAVLHVAAH